MLIDGLVAQSIPDIVHQEREQKKKHPKVHRNEPKVSGNENVPHESESNKKIQLPDPSPLESALLILAFGLLIVGGLWFLIVAFRTSIGWGLGCLFIPFVSLVYLIQYWEEARRPFALQVVGILVLVIAVVL